MTDKAIKYLTKEIAKRNVKVEDDTVVRFRSKAPNGTTYTYAAVYVVGHWWITGVANYFGGTKLTNERFLEIVSKGTITDVEVATGFAAVKEG